MRPDHQWNSKKLELLSLNPHVWVLRSSHWTLPKTLLPLDNNFWTEISNMRFSMSFLKNEKQFWETELVKSPFIFFCWVSYRVFLFMDLQLGCHVCSLWCSSMLIWRLFQKSSSSVTSCWFWCGWFEIFLCFLILCYAFQLKVHIWK